MTKKYVPSKTVSKQRQSYDSMSYVSFPHNSGSPNESTYIFSADKKKQEECDAHIYEYDETLWKYLCRKCGKEQYR